MKTYRDINQREQLWLDTLLSINFAERDVIRRQISMSKVYGEKGSSFISLKFKVDNNAEKILSEERVPIAMIALQANSEPIEFLIHIVDGFIDELEIYTSDGLAIDIDNISLQKLVFEIRKDCIVKLAGFAIHQAEDDVAKQWKNIDIKDLPLDILKLPTEWGGEDVALFNLNDSLILLDYCLENNIAILGFEGFKKANYNYILIMDYVVDFSELYQKERDNFLKKSIEISKKIISALPQANIDILFDGDMLFEFVLMQYVIEGQTT